jgi:hypothetical protein
MYQSTAKRMAVSTPPTSPTLIDGINVNIDFLHLVKWFVMQPLSMDPGASLMLPAVIQTWYAARGLWGPACDLVSTLRPWRAGFQDNLDVARATRGWFRGAHSIGMIVKLAAQTTVNATALIITAFLLRGWMRIHPFVFRIRWRPQEANTSCSADSSFF